MFLGIDIGTTNLKVGLYDISGNEVSFYSIPAKTYSDKFGDFYLMDEVWRKICDVIKKVVLKTHKKKIIAVCVSSIGESVIVLDKNGNILLPTIAWYDRRTEKELMQVEENISREEIFKITGLYPGYIYSLLKVLWFKNNFPKLFSKIKKILSVSDYINYKLTGEICYDFSQASRTMMFDIKNKVWSDRILELFGIDKRNLPSLYPSSSVVGNISKKAQEETGLSRNTKVVLGGHDHIVGAFGCGVHTEDEVLDSIGTAESIFRPLDKLVNQDKIYKSNFSIGCNVIKDKYYLIGGIYSSGGTIEWLMQEVVKENDYNFLINEARKSPPGARGLFFLPHLRGSGPPNRNVFSRGAFLGLTAKHKIEDIIRAVFEGLCYESRIMIEGMKNILPALPKKIVVIGGGVKNKLWMEIKGDLLGFDIEIQESVESVCFGSALLCGMGLGIYSLDDVKKLSSKHLKKYSYNRENFKKYDTYYKSVYKKIYPLLKNINFKISDLFS